MRHNVIALALGTMLVTTPALAEGKSGERAASKKATASDTTKYCMKYDDLVGTRISKQECLTKREWAAQGVDIDEELKNSGK
jgi:hypothetical protein